MDTVLINCIKSNNLLMFEYILDKNHEISLLSILRLCVELEKSSYLDLMLEKEIIDPDAVIKMCVYLSKLNLLQYYLSMYKISKKTLDSLAYYAIIYSSDDVLDYMTRFVSDYTKYAVFAYVAERYNVYNKLLDNKLVDKSQLKQLLSLDNYAQSD
jgi:hypothetical protein